MSLLFETPNDFHYSRNWPILATTATPYNYSFLSLAKIQSAVQNCSRDFDSIINPSYVYTFTNHLLLIYPWLFLILGMATNTLSFLVFTQPQLKKSSTFFYLSFLSIVDMLSLHLFCINFILLYQFELDMQKLSVFICKSYAFLIYFLPQLSAWICAAVSLDRVVCVLLGVKARHFNK